METSRELKTAREVQQQISYGFSSPDNRIFWDLYTENDGEMLKTKIFVLMPDAKPDIEIKSIRALNLNAKETELKCNQARDNCKKYNARITETRSNLFNQIWSQRKYCGGNLLSTIIYVMLAAEQKEYQNSFILAENSTEFSVHPVFRVRKCIVDNDSSNCCMIFVDESGRVYQNWNKYLKDNTLPKGVMVFPKNGIYKEQDGSDKLILDCQFSPACSKLRQCYETFDKGASIVGLAAAGILFAPVGATVVTGAAIAAGGTCAYSFFRSTNNLIDRSNHEESINITDRQARNSWFGVAGAVAGATAGAASKVLSKVAASATSEVPVVFQYFVNGANLSSIAISGAGIGCGLIDFYGACKDNSISTLDIVQLSAALVLFTHSLHNYQSASTIIEKAQIKTIDQFMQKLSTRQRKAFNKLKLETLRIKGAEMGRYDVIRGIETVPDNKYFNDIYKINKQLNQNKIRPSFADNGKVVLNNDKTILASELRQNVQQNPSNNILHQVASDIPSTYTSIVSSNTQFSFPIQFNYSKIIFEAINEFLINGPDFVSNQMDYVNCLIHIYEKLKKKGLDVLHNIVRTFFEEYRMELEEQLRRILPFEVVLWDLFRIFTSNNDIMLDWENLEQYSRYFLFKLKEYYDKLISPSGNKQKCRFCDGYYFLI